MIKERGFIGYLLKHKEDRGVMADLRCGFSQARQIRAWPHVVRFCKTNDNDPTDRFDKEDLRTIFLTVGAAFASHPINDETPYSNFGDVLRRIAITGTDDLEKALKSFDGRFRRLLACHSGADVCRWIQGIVHAAESKNIPIPYNQLLNDLLYWDQSKKVRWAQKYWGAAEPQMSEEDTAKSPVTETGGTP